jgi:GNAT superfamily N-acetyltransferase
VSDLAPADATLMEGYTPGLAGEIIALHMAYYGPAWGFGAPFEAVLATGLGAFLAGYDPVRDLLLAARGADGALLGTITIEGAPEPAHLRWFVVDARARGTGLGGALMAAAVRHLDRHGRRCTLATFRGLDAARALYERHGFRLAGEAGTDPWSGTVGVLRYERDPAG